MVVLLPLGSSCANHHLSSYMIEPQYQEILITSTHASIAFLVGYALYRLLRIKTPLVKITEYGRNWMAWGVMFACTSSFVLITTQLTWVAFFATIATIMLVGLLGYIIGLAYGILNKFGFVSYVKTTIQDSHKESNLDREHKYFPMIRKIFTTTALYFFIIYFSSLLSHNLLDPTNSFSTKTLEKYELTK